MRRDLAARRRGAGALDAALARWPPERLLIFCDEDAPLANPLAALAAAPPAAGVGLLIGPEGGFDEAERARSCDAARAASQPRPAHPARRHRRRSRARAGSVAVRGLEVRGRISPSPPVGESERGSHTSASSYGRVKIPGLALLIETASEEDLLFDAFWISRPRAPTLSPHFPDGVIVVRTPGANQL